jgi:hypothetical protein
MEDKRKALGLSILITLILSGFVGLVYWLPTVWDSIPEEWQPYIVGGLIFTFTVVLIYHVLTDDDAGEEC